MNVIAYDPYIPASRAGMLDVELVELDGLLERANVVTLHVPLTSQTRNMIDVHALARMREDAVLVNCARGAVVDLDALLATLETGKLRAVALDVVQQEPPPAGSASARALTHPRIIATPHLGGSTHEALERIAMELATDVVRVLQGRPAGGAVNAPSYHGGDAQHLNGVVELAFRMGAMLPQLFDEALRHEIVLVLHGDLEEVDAEPLLAAVLAGALPFVSDRRLSTVNARAIADELGVRMTIAREKAVAPFRSALTLLAGDHRIVGTVLPTGPRIVRIDGFELDAIAQGTAIVTRHRDVPGMVGHIGTILGEAHVNISTMQVARTNAGGDAMMLLEVDLEGGFGSSREVLDAIAGVDGVESVRILHF
jgi:D-3-phosphoglycerate dehydrogenase